MRLKSSLAALLCLLMWTACDQESPAGPSVPLNQEFTLAPGEAASIQGASLHVQFQRVSGDSRCPADAVCIQGGDALVHVAVRGSRTAEYELHTGDSARASVQHEGLRITLVRLEPYPFSSRTIPPEEYRATFTVSK